MVSICWRLVIEIRNRDLFFFEQFLNAKKGLFPDASKGV